MNGKLSALMVIGVIVILILGGFYFFQKEDWKGETIGFRWHREWDEQTFMAVNTSQWVADGVPEHAYNITVRREVHHFNQIFAGETCVKVGKSNVCTPHYIRVPVYRDKAYYTINTWRVTRTLATDGDDNRMRNLHWPVLDLTPICGEDQNRNDYEANDGLLGCMRAGTQREWYYVSVAGDGITQECNIDYPRWSDMRIGELVQAMKWKWQNLVDCHDLRFN